MPVLICSEELKNHPKVKSYCVRGYFNGMCEIQFNTHERWVRCNALNDEMYEFPDNDDDVYTDMIEVKPFLVEGISYIRYNKTVKDQIFFMYIPTNLLLEN